MRIFVRCALLGLLGTAALLASASHALAETATTGGTAQSAPVGSYDSGFRLALQARVDDSNIISGSQGAYSSAPWVTGGVRFLDDRLFAGLGFGFFGINDDGGSGFSLSPLVNYDILTDRLGALYLLGWLDLGSVSQAGNAPDVFFFGANVGAGVRGRISKALAVGVELGWEFSKADVDQNGFAHGIFGALVFETSLAI